MKTTVSVPMENIRVKVTQPKNLNLDGETLIGVIQYAINEGTFIFPGRKGKEFRAVYKIIHTVEITPVD
jgi:hypothetical protein